MRCVRCGKDTPYRSRPKDERCSCGEPFAFEPKYRHPLADAAFAAAIDRVSAGGSLRWLPVHLYYEVCRRIDRRRLLHRRVVPIDHAGFDRLWSRWTGAHGWPPTALADDDALTASPTQLPPDVADYAVDRAVVTDSDATLRLLLANNFHVDNRCAVLTVGGEPSGVSEAVLAMLRRSEQLTVLALHDASVAGSTMASRLLFEDQWFRDLVADGTATVVDLGLRPDQAKQFRACFLRTDQRPASDAILSKKDHRWLSRYRLELAAVLPATLMGRLQRTFTAPIGAVADAFAGPVAGGDGDDGFG